MITQKKYLIPVLKGALLIYILSFAVIFSANAQNASPTPVNKKNRPVYMDPSQPLENRINDLMSRMTLEEKTSQMRNLFFSDYMKDVNVIDTAKVHTAINGMSYCSVISRRDQNGKELAKSIAMFKRYIAKHNRLNIPVICAMESLHGLMHEGFTIFPQSIAIGSAFNPDLMYRVARQIALESKAAGIDQVLAPDLDLARELRWGRVEEAFGEDPYLVGRMGVAYVKAFNEQKIICTPKHFVAHGSPLGGLNLASVPGDDRDLYSLYLKPFAEVIRETGVYSIMNSYSSYEGVPAAASKKIMTDLLRNELGFQGYVSSDWASIEMLHFFQKVAENAEDAAIQAVRAGIDCEVSGLCYANLNRLVEEGKLDESEIDRCVERVLRTKFAMGLFDNPNIPDTTRVDKAVHAPEAIEVALEAARESAVLLKNDNSLLPLQIDKLKSLAVIGPNAAKARFGDYCWTNDGDYGISPLEGIRTLTEGKIKINHAEGCDTWSQDKSKIAEAVDAAKASDIAIIFAGTESGNPGLPLKGATSGESYDLSDLSLPGVQSDLIKAVAETGKPTILVFVSGKPLSLAWEKDNLPAIIVQWYAGEQQGRAIAEILFGSVNPSGKLNVSFPKSAGHLPVYYNHYPTDKGFYKIRGSSEKPGSDYVFSDPAPLWAFGHGLSYTE
jgi:beta-glucosidase